MFTHWKTSSSGLALVLTGLTGILHAFNPNITGPDLSTALVSIVSGIGLICGKDFNVSGTK